MENKFNQVCQNFWEVVHVWMVLHINWTNTFLKCFMKKPHCQSIHERSYGSVRAHTLTCTEEDYSETLLYTQHKHIKTDIWTKIPLFAWLRSPKSHPIPLYHLSLCFSFNRPLPPAFLSVLHPLFSSVLSIGPWGVMERVSLRGFSGRSRPGGLLRAHPAVIISL